MTGRCLLATSLLLGIPQFAYAQFRECKDYCYSGNREDEPGDLSLGNLCSAGWDEPFEERSKSGRAVRFKLFRTWHSLGDWPRMVVGGRF